MTVPRKPYSVRVIFIVLAVVTVAVVLIALLQKPPAPPAALAIATATPTPRREMPTPFSSPIPYDNAASASAMPSPTAGPIPAWEISIDQILRSNASEAQMAQMLINLLPTLPEQGQIEAANHIANLIPDSNYDTVRPLLLNTNLPQSVLSVFFTDLMNRDDTDKLTAFLDIAQIPNHPFHDDAISDLQIYVGDNYGTDWDKWKGAVVQYLKNANDPQSVPRVIGQ